MIRHPIYNPTRDEIEAMKSAIREEWIESRRGGCGEGPTKREPSIRECKFPFEVMQYGNFDG
jgi:hypothetical protein